MLLLPLAMKIFTEEEEFELDLEMKVEFELMAVFKGSSRKAGGGGGKSVNARIKNQVGRS